MLPESSAQPELDAYLQAFSVYLQTGDQSVLSDFVDQDAHPEFLSIYRNGFFKTCIAALQSNFSCTAAMVGDDYFNHIARRYVEQNPPMSGTLVGYGLSFAEWLTQQQIDPAYLTDLAHLDHAWISVLAESDESVLTGEQVQRIIEQGQDISGCWVRLPASARVLQTHYQILPVWLQLKEQGGLSQQTSLTADPERVLIWRHHGQVQVKSLNDLELVLVCQLQSGVLLGQLFEQLMEMDPELDLSEIFALYLNNGLLVMPEVQEQENSSWKTN